MSDQADIALAKQIARRAVARHDRRQAAQRNALQLALNTAQTTLAEQSSELRDAGEAVSLLQERCASLEAERDAALADARYHQKCFNQMITAMQAANSGRYAHIAAALRRREAIT